MGRLFTCLFPPFFFQDICNLKLFRFIIPKICCKLFLQDQEHCTNTGLKVVGNNHKPLFLKEIKKLWEDPELRKVIGDLNETNTLLIDDSPYKAQKNPVSSIMFSLLFFPCMLCF